MNPVSILYIVFTIILYSYLLLLRRELVFVARRRSLLSVVGPILAALFIGGLYFPTRDIGLQIQGACGMLLVLSYLINSRGIAEDRFVLHSLDNKGLKFEEISRIILFEDRNKKIVKMNYFQNNVLAGLFRGPNFTFNASVEELVLFFSEKLKQGTPVDVIVLEDKSKKL